LAQLGSDISGVEDLDPALSVVTGRRALAEAVGRRYVTPAGTHPDDPFYGYDLSEAVGSGTPPEEIEQHALAQARAEEEIEEASAVTEITGAIGEQTLEMLITLVDSAGPFTFTVTIDADLTLSILLGSS